LIQIENAEREQDGDKDPTFHGHLVVGHGIDAVRAHWPASAEPLQSEAYATPDAVQPHGFNHVVRAGWGEAATARK